MFCHNCGEKNEDGARFCNECGTGLVVTGPGAPAPAPDVQPVIPGAVPAGTPSPVTGSEKATPSIPISPITICAALLIFSFFMPLITVEGISVSGYQISELARLFGASGVQLVWVVPLMGAAALVAGLYRKHQWLVVLAGAASIGTFIYLLGTADLYKPKNDTAFSLIGFGAWLMLAMGVALVGLAVTPLARLMTTERGRKEVMEIPTKPAWLACLAVMATGSLGLFLYCVFHFDYFTAGVPDLGYFSYIIFWVSGAFLDYIDPLRLAFLLDLLSILFGIVSGIVLIAGQKRRAVGWLLVFAGLVLLTSPQIIVFGVVEFPVLLGLSVLSVTSTRLFLKQIRQRNADPSLRSG